MDIELSNLTKNFGSTVAVDNVSLALTGKINLLLGSNGSGKSTLINLLAGLAFPNKGTLKLDGSEYNATIKKQWRKGTERLRSKAKFWLDKPGLPQPMTGRDLLKFESNQTKKKRKEDDDKNGRELEVLIQNSFGTTVDLDKPISSYSSGMQQKLGIMATLIGNPEFVVWDEPTAALDAISRGVVARLAKEFAARGTIFLIASHIPGDFEGIADWIGLMRLGHLVKNGNLRDLNGSDYDCRDYIVSTDRPVQLASRLLDLGLATTVSLDEEKSEVSLKATEKFDPQKVNDLAKDSYAGHAVVRKRERSITELYLEALA